jgi:hypothetical protein
MPRRCHLFSLGYVVFGLDRFSGLLGVGTRVAARPFGGRRLAFTMRLSGPPVENDGPL